jgi:hypothetical protein
VLIDSCKEVARGLQFLHPIPENSAVGRFGNPVKQAGRLYEDDTVHGRTDHLRASADGDGHTGKASHRQDVNIRTDILPAEEALWRSGAKRGATFEDPGRGKPVTYADGGGPVSRKAYAPGRALKEALRPAHKRASVIC